MDLRVIEIKDLEEAEEELAALNVHKGGVAIMAPKAVTRIIKIGGIDSVALNILKQEMLSAGGDCAVSWDAFIRRNKDSEGILIGTIAQISEVCEKLEKQPFGLSALAQKIRALEAGYCRKDIVLRAGRYKLNLGKRAHIMGVLNVTPDSFSDGGMFFDREYAVGRGLKMESDGADIIDIGGESTRPGAKPVPVREECRRVIPVIKALAKRLRTPVSVDTSKSEVAEKALDAGAAMINDVTGLRRDRRIAKLAVRYKAALVLMHMKGSPRTMQKDPRYKDLMSEIADSLRKSAAVAEEAGVSGDRIVVDPGIGFGKTLEHNLIILNKLGELRSLGYPVMVGPSRKAFIGKVSGAGTGGKVPPERGRAFGTAAAVALAINAGANIVRVHDVKEMRQVAQITEAILNV
ncbi:MAG: dihydropteroate synthase [Candidatus Omnitrophica bacterium]|nr:dihydropteroate synthase [Candidatus Omnitrophota bacterium]